MGHCSPKFGWQNNTIMHAAVIIMAKLGHTTIRVLLNSLYMPERYIIYYTYDVWYITILDDIFVS